MSPITPDTVDAGGIEIAYETFGEEGDPPALLVMGLGTQMIWWDDEFCSALADRGYRVIRFDNRDVGLSTHLHDAPTPDVMAALGGDTSSASYTLDDMADDAFGLLDALGIDSAHVVGVSMGGMIAQTMAIRQPARVRSLVSIMSTTGDSAVGQPTQEATEALVAPMPSNRDEAIERTVSTWHTIRSPGFSYDEERTRELAELSHDRAFDPAGFGRQLLAILASGDRTANLRRVDVPALVIHGDADILVQPSGGEATAAAIPGADLMIVEGMGHDLPREVWERILDGVEATARRGEEDEQAA
jgi:pimeloyl-ACP methyl ester carboxylesterase